MEDTGERLIPKLHQQSLTYGEHLVRYRSVLGAVAGKVVLDIACGAGYGSQLLATVAQQVHAMDISAEAIAYAKQNYAAKNISFQTGDATKITLPDQSIDVVVSFETIEHIEGYDKFVAEVKRILKPDGQFIVSTPNDKEFPPGNHYHVHQFVQSEYKEFLEKTFRKVKLYYQDSWFATAVLAEADFEHGEAIQTSVAKTFAETTEQAVYFVAVCSDQEPVKLDQALALSDRYSAKADQAADRQRRDQMDGLQSQNQEFHQTIQRQTQEFDQINSQLRGILDSRSWKLYQRAVLPLARLLHAGSRRRSKKPDEK